MSMSEPLNVLTRNVGNGSMEVSWDAPLSGVVASYNVYICTTLAGTYQKANHFPITGRIAKICNLQFNTTIYTKVAALDSLGVVGPFSVAAADADCNRASLSLTIEAPVGDVIDPDALFAAFVGGELIAFQLTEGGTITG